MRRKSFRGVWLLVAWLALAPAVAWGQPAAIAPAAWEQPTAFALAVVGGQSTVPETGGVGSEKSHSAPAEVWEQLAGPAPAVVWGQLADFAPTVVRGQSANEVESYAPSSFTMPLPVGSNRPEDGGFFAFAQAVYFTQTNPLKSQIVGTYGFRDMDGTITGVVGQFVGSDATALNVNQLTGQDSYVIGTEMGVGWKFGNGSSIAVNWTYFSEENYRAGATGVPPIGVLNQNLSNSFLYAPVVNIPPQYSGPDFKIRFPVPTSPLLPNGLPNFLNPNFGQPSAQAAFGIWNGASIMTIDFIQRFQQYEVIYREPIYETENYRLNGLVGPRYAWIWERFNWTTTASAGAEINPNQAAGGFQDPVVLSAQGPQDVAIYNNIVSNRMYGAVAGCEQEWYIGHGIVCQLKLEGALFVDSAKTIAQYSLEDRFVGLPESKHANRLWSIVPEADATAGLMWYPAEFVQLYAGYQVMGFVNTIAARVPIALDYSNIDPHYSHVNRVMNGIKGGIAFTF